MVYKEYCILIHDAEDLPEGNHSIIITAGDKKLKSQVEKKGLNQDWNFRDNFKIFLLKFTLFIFRKS